MAGKPTGSRVPVRGTIGKRIPLGGTTSSSGAQIGVNLELPDGTIPTLAQLAAILADPSYATDSGGVPATPITWQNITFVPPNVSRLAQSGVWYPPPPDDPEDGLIVPGPAGKDGANGTSGFPLYLEPEQPDDPLLIPGPTGAAGATGAQGLPGVSGQSVMLFQPDEPEDHGPMPGVAGPPGSTGPAGAAGVQGITFNFEADDPEQLPPIPGNNASALMQQRGGTWSSVIALTTPANDIPITIAEDCTIQDVTILTEGGTGSCTIDIWRTPVGSGTYPPTVANTILNTRLPVTSGKYYRDTALSEFNTTALAQGDSVIFHLATCSVFTSVTILMTLKRVGSTSADGYTDARAISALEGASPTMTGAWTFDPTAGNNVYIQNAANAPVQIIGSATTGESFGLEITAGTNSSDTPFSVADHSGVKTYFEVQGNGALSGYGPTLGSQVDMTPDVGTVVLTPTGISSPSSSTVTATWRRSGGLVTWTVPAITGTSTSTAFTLTGTIPAAIVPATTKYIVVGPIEDAGTIGAAQMDVAVTGSALVFLKNGSSAGFTNTSSTKGVSSNISFSYSVD